MKVTLSFVPPGGGETDYEVECEVPFLPREGDYLTLRSSSDAMTSDFIVRRIRWHIRASEDDETASVETIVVEAEFALGPLSSDNHKASCSMYEGRGKPPNHFEDSVY